MYLKTYKILYLKSFSAQTYNARLSCQYQLFFPPPLTSCCDQRDGTATVLGRTLRCQLSPPTFTHPHQHCTLVLCFYSYFTLLLSFLIVSHTRTTAFVLILLVLHTAVFCSTHIAHYRCLFTRRTRQTNQLPTPHCRQRATFRPKSTRQTLSNQPIGETVLPQEQALLVVDFFSR